MEAILMLGVYFKRAFYILHYITYKLSEGRR